MDYTYFSTGPAQSFQPYAGGLHPQDHQPAPRSLDGVPFSGQGHTDIFDSGNYFPFDPYSYANTHQSPPGGNPASAPPPQGIPPLPSPHPPTEPQQQQPQPQPQPAQPQPQPQPQHQFPAPQNRFEPSPSDVSSARTGDGSASAGGSAGGGGVQTNNDTMMVDDVPADETQPGRSSSEEKDTANLTPAQSRRKAQNRAAQRAFRERKEKRVRDLEEELNQYKQNVTSLAADNENLKRQIAKVATENEILRATVHGGGGGGGVAANQNGAGDAVHAREEHITMGPMKYSPMDYTPQSNGSGGSKDSPSPSNNGNNNVGVNGSNVSNESNINGEDVSSSTAENHAPTISHRAKVNETTGEKLLDAAGTWDLIVRHRSDQNVTLDVQDIYERLKGKTQCDGQQPVIEEAHVRKAISESAAAAREELL